MITIVLIVFLIGLAAISTEQRTGINKSASALVTAGATWLTVAAFGAAGFADRLTQTGAEIIEILLFLLSAMVLVEIIAHYRFFDMLQERIASRGIGYKQQLWVISVFAFLLSAVIDNLTTTIIFTQLTRLFFKGKNLVVAAALVVIAANAGGAFSPIGDVTTTMLWLQNKFTSTQIISFGFLPSLIMFLTAASLMSMQIKNTDTVKPKTEPVELLKSERLVLAIAFGSFAMPFVFNLIGLKPYLGLLSGLGITWMTIDILKRKLPNHGTHFTAAIENLLKNTDISSLMFFAGILLAVSALDYVGFLKTISHVLFGASPGLFRMFSGSAILGLASAIVDNVPLTAAALKIVNTSDPQIWTLIALTVGNGGSILAIGSAAGIVAMGIVKDMTFTRYLKIASIPAVIAYICAIAIWYLQYLVFIK